MALPYVIEQPFAVGPQKTGAFSDETYEVGPPWIFNQTDSPANCKPYGNAWTPMPDGCRTCAATASGTCSGQKIPRPPSNSLRSPELPVIRGVQFYGAFGGTAMTLDPRNIQQAYVQAFFYHQKRDYWGGVEYGFERLPLEAQSGGPEFFFYWSINSNCGGNPLYSMKPVCSDLKAGDETSWLWENSPKVGEPQSKEFYMDSKGHGIIIPAFSGENYWSAWPCRDTDGFWKFRIMVTKPDYTIRFDALVDPNWHDPVTKTCKYGCWYPIEELNRSSGFISATTNLYDPFNLISLDSASLAVTKVRVGLDRPPVRRSPR